MARNMQLAPNSMATTSTGLNYLLGEDNDTVRVPYSDGKNFEMYLREREGIEKKQNKERLYREYKEDMRRKKVMDSKQMAAEGGRIGYNEGNMVLPKPKPAQSPLVELSRIYKTYEDAMPGVSKDTQKYLQQDFIQKLQDAKISQEEFMTYRMQNNLADGGPARKGYAGGKGVDIARRGFLKILGGSVAAATAFKMGLVKMLGKESGAVSKKAVDEFFASGTSGAPTWFEPLVNKALKEGLDITEKAAVKDGQIVKQLDTPTGKVDVTYDTRTGAVDVDYMGGDTAMGEGLQMRYAPGDIIEEGANMGKKTDDVFEAVESIPEFQGGNYMDGPDLGFGENMTSNIDDLYSDTSELATLGGEKLLVKDISNTLKKKKILKEMDNNPQEFAQDMSPDTYYDD